MLPGSRTEFRVSGAVSPSSNGLFLGCLIYRTVPVLKTFSWLQIDGRDKIWCVFHTHDHTIFCIFVWDSLSIVQGR